MAEAQGGGASRRTEQPSRSTLRELQTDERRGKAQSGDWKRSGGRGGRALGLPGSTGYCRRMRKRHPETPTCFPLTEHALEKPPLRRVPQNLGVSVVLRLKK